jgi:hypothetical protein
VKREQSDLRGQQVPWGQPALRESKVRKAFKGSKASLAQQVRPVQLVLRDLKACRASKVRPVLPDQRVQPVRKAFRVSKEKQAPLARPVHRAPRANQEQSAPKVIPEILGCRGFRAFKDRRGHKESKDQPELMAMALLTSAK